jgi:hypothetical protein
MAVSNPELLTVRQIADALGETKNRVFYALRRRGLRVDPAGCASQTLLFHADVVPVVRAVLKAIDANRISALRLGELDESGGCNDPS